MRATVILSASRQEMLPEGNYPCRGAGKMTDARIAHLITKCKMNTVIKASFVISLLQFIFVTEMLSSCLYSK